MEAERAQKGAEKKGESGPIERFRKKIRNSGETAATAWSNTNRESEREKVDIAQSVEFESKANDERVIVHDQRGV